MVTSVFTWHNLHRSYVSQTVHFCLNCWRVVFFSWMHNVVRPCALTGANEKLSSSDLWACVATSVNNSYIQTVSTACYIILWYYIIGYDGSLNAEKYSVYEVRRNSLLYCCANLWWNTPPCTLFDAGIWGMVSLRVWFVWLSSEI